MVHGQIRSPGAISSQKGYVATMSPVVLSLDSHKSLSSECTTGHNRWHWEIAPAIECRSGDEVVLATRDALDGQLNRSSTSKDLSSIDRGRIHPLSGPVWVEDAEPGDLLQVDVLEVTPDDYGFTSQRPGLGLLHKDLTEPYLVHWELSDGLASSAQLPGVKIVGDPFLGIMGVAPSASMIADVLEREGSSRFSPVEPSSAIPATARVKVEGLRTGPPRENGGNFDVKQLGAGAKVFLPVWQQGALFSAGDAHFAQGDGEVCGTAIEMRSTARLRLTLHKNIVNLEKSPLPFFEFTPRADSSPSPVFVTLGYPSSHDGDRLMEAAASAIRQLASRLVDAYDFSFSAAYALCSVAVDLRVVQVVNEPNISVTATISLGIFDDLGERLSFRGDSQ
jgi:formamidase